MSMQKISKEQLPENAQEQDQDEVTVLKVKTRLRAGDECCKGVIIDPGPVVGRDTIPSDRTN